MSMPEQKPGKSRQDYQTPIEFLTAVKGLLAIEKFSIDLAASAENAICDVYYDESMNALSLDKPWSLGGGWAWLNPPFAHITPWVKKAWEQSEQGASIAVLVPASVGSNWWKDWVHNKASVVFLNGRITFVGEETCYPKDCALLLYGFPEPMPYDIWSWSK